jgi:DNA-binding NarL/FixJ family response regulator
MQPSFTTASDFSWLAPRAGAFQRPEDREPTFSPVDLAEVWRGLAEGSYSIVSTLFSNSRCFVALQGPSAFGATLRTADVKILERILLGESQKSVALDLGCALSTVSNSARQCLHAMGWPRVTSRAPVLLVMAVHAARGYPVAAGRLSRIHGRILGRWLVSAERPDCFLETRLPPSEWSVARFLLEGRSHAEMALLRRTSVRTIANQLASVFAKLGVSGRSEFLARLVREPCKR